MAAYLIVSPNDKVRIGLIGAGIIGFIRTVNNVVIDFQSDYVADQSDCACVDKCIVIYA